MKKCLSANALKYIAVLAMLIDHIAWAFVPFGSVAGQAMHIIGRITAPIMCFCIAEGYYHTRDIKKYALRLFIFALISHFPFVFFETGKWLIFSSTGVIAALLCGLLGLWAWDKIKVESLKLTAVICIIILSLPADWSFFAVAWIIIFGICRENYQKQALWFSLTSVAMVLSSSLFDIANGLHFYNDFFQLGVFLALIPISMYNGERGSKGAFNKWFFYIFYPLHLLTLGIIKYYII